MGNEYNDRDHKKDCCYLYVTGWKHNDQGLVNFHNYQEVHSWPGVFAMSRCFPFPPPGYDKKIPFADEKWLEKVYACVCVCVCA